MAEVIRLPRMSDTMTEGVIVEWHKKINDKIQSGDVLADIETDKATMELESYQDGFLLHLGAGKGESVQVDEIIAVIGEKGEDFQNLLKEKSNQKVSSVDTKSTDNQDQEDLGGDTETKVNAQVIRMPLLSDTMTAGKIIKWYKKVGDEIASDDILAEVETDKAVMEVVGYVEGTLLHIGVEEGKEAKVNKIIAIVGEKGANVNALLEEGKNSPETPSNNQTSAPLIPSESKTSPIHENPSHELPLNNDRIKASPLAKKIAREKSIRLQDIQGSGEGGRIIKKDLESFSSVLSDSHLSSQPLSATSNLPEFEDITVSQMRKTIALRLSQSKFSAPHFYLNVSVDMGLAMETRKKMNEFSEVKISFNDLIVKACAVALRSHPEVNSSWKGDFIRKNNRVNIGIAVAVPEGLLVPVIRDADLKNLRVISTETKNFATKAKERKLTPVDWEGNTFTISNLGMFNIDEFTAIINSPDAGILAVGAIKDVPVVRDGNIVSGHIMKLTLSCDHRVVDGSTGAQFLNLVKSYLENPAMMLV